MEIEARKGSFVIFYVNEMNSLGMNSGASIGRGENGGKSFSLSSSDGFTLYESPFLSGTLVGLLRFTTLWQLESNGTENSEEMVWHSKCLLTAIEPLWSKRYMKKQWIFLCPQERKGPEYRWDRNTQQTCRRFTSLSAWVRRIPGRWEKIRRGCCHIPMDYQQHNGETWSPRIPVSKNETN